MTYLTQFFISFFLTAIATPYLIKYFMKVGIVDYPGERKIHESIIPRMGGLLIYVISLLMLFSFWRNLTEIRLLILGSFIIGLCGFLDDVFRLSWRSKIIIQFIGALFLLLYLSSNIIAFSFLGYSLPDWIGYTVLLFFVVGTLNSVNMMDGMDGLVSGFSLLIFSVVAVLAFYKGNFLLLAVSAIIAGACLGFLRFNAYPAKIFLGDTGALILGYFMIFTVSSLSIMYGTNGQLDFAFPMIILGVPIFDALKVIFIRLVNKRSPFLPDKNHLHHIIIGNRVRHKITVLIIHLFR